MVTLLLAGVAAASAAFLVLQSETQSGGGCVVSAQSEGSSIYRVQASSEQHYFEPTGMFAEADCPTQLYEELSEDGSRTVYIFVVSLFQLADAYEECRLKTTDPLHVLPELYAGPMLGHILVNESCDQLLPDELEDLDRLHEQGSLQIDPDYLRWTETEEHLAQRYGLQTVRIGYTTEGEPVCVLYLFAWSLADFVYSVRDVADIAVHCIVKPTWEPYP